MRSNNPLGDQVPAPLRDRDRLASLYASGMGARRIAREIGDVSHTAVLKALRRHGIEPRRRGRR